MYQVNMYYNKIKCNIVLTYFFNSFAWGTYLWRYTHDQMRKVFNKLEAFNDNYVKTNKKKDLKYTVLGFMYPFKVIVFV